MLLRLLVRLRQVEQVVLGRYLLQKLGDLILQQTTIQHGRLLMRMVQQLLQQEPIYFHNQYLQLLQLTIRFRIRITRPVVQMQRDLRKC